MTNLSLSGYGEIRVTPDERYSVFDVIEVIGGKKNPYETWSRLADDYPEVLTKCENFKFPGKGQRLTPVTNKEGLLQIIGLLPGAVGRSYREEAAKLMLAKVEGRLTEVVIDSSNEIDNPIPTPKEIAEAIACVFCFNTVDPALVQGLIANEIGKAHPQLKPQMEAAKKLLPLPIEEELLTVTELARQYVQQRGKPLTPNNTDMGNAIALNKLLLSLGLQEKNTTSKQPAYLPTEKGKPFSKVVLQEANSNNKTVQQLRWMPSVLEVFS